MGENPQCFEPLDLHYWSTPSIRQVLSAAVPSGRPDAYWAPCMLPSADYVCATITVRLVHNEGLWLSRSADRLGEQVAPIASSSAFDPFELEWFRAVEDDDLSVTFEIDEEGIRSPSDRSLDR